MLRLTNKAAELLVRPEIGGAITAYRVGGKDVLRPALEGSDDPLAMSCFPLAPYSNRIANGCFTFEGVTHTVPLNFGDHPHSVHGLGWQRPWDVAELRSDYVRLVHDHDGGVGWPWAYIAEQEIALAPSSLKVSLALTNQSNASMPAGLGLHPYFPRTAATRLTFTAARCWEIDETCLPTHPADADRFGDWANGFEVEGDTLIDNSFEAWTGTARIDQRDMTVTVAATGATGLHLLRSPTAKAFCVEPVSHMPDALNRDAAMTILASGETVRMAMALRVEPVSTNNLKNRQVQP